MAWRDRHPKLNPNVRCCWVCGRVGGFGFTKALQEAGYQITHGKEIGYAHPRCMRIAHTERRGANR